MYPKELFKGHRQLEYWQILKYSSAYPHSIVSSRCPLFFMYLVRVDSETMVLFLAETYRYNGQSVTKKHAWKFNHRVAIRVYTDVMEWYHKRNLFLK